MMAITTSGIKTTLDDCAREIDQTRRQLADAKALINAGIARLNSIPTKYKPMIDAVNAASYGTPAHEAANKAELAALTSEFQVLNSQAKSANTWLATNVTEF